VVHLTGFVESTAAKRAIDRVVRPVAGVTVCATTRTYARPDCAASDDYHAIPFLYSVQSLPMFAT